jgi:transcriptional regulator with XRE-family HTH domain
VENTSKPKIVPKQAREVFYFRQRQKNRFFGEIASFFSEEAERRGITRKDLAVALGRDPAQITRWLSNPSNMTLDSISDILLAMDAEIDGPSIIRFSERPKSNYAHPIIRAILNQKAAEAAKRKNSVSYTVTPPDSQLVAAPVSYEGPSDRNHTFLIEVGA